MERVIRKIETTVPMQPRLLRVAAYARVSSGKDAMLHSLSGQVTHYSQLIQQHDGWQLMRSWRPSRKRWSCWQR